MSAAAKKVEAAAKSLPEGWRQVPLGELVDPNRPKVKPADKPDLPFIGMEHIESNTMTLLGTVPASTMKSNAVHFQPGDVLYGRLRPYLNKVFRPTFEGLCSAEFIVMPENDDINGKYLQYFLNSSAFVFFASHLKEGDRPRVDFKILSPYEVPIPPTKDDQERIVAEIEKQFSRLDEAVASLKRVKANLKRYKAAILKAAVEGKLTEEWRKQNPDVEPASKLLERILAERRTKWEEAELAKMKAKGKEPKNDKWKEKYKEPVSPKPSKALELPVTWCNATIGQVVECLDSIRKPINKKERLSRVGEIPYYGANGQVGVIDDYLFDEPLVLVVEDETFVGRTQPFSYKISGKTWVNNHAHVLRPTEVIGLDYLNYSLMFYPFIPLTTGTTGRKKLTQKALMCAPYRLPPILEQEEISAAIEEKLSVTEKVEEELARSEVQLTSMRQSVLADAFQGTLLCKEIRAA